eukprot:COSAG02_NODE_2601_length_8448_cov_37.777339_5_plen_78_part_00
MFDFFILYRYFQSNSSRESYEFPAPCCSTQVEPISDKLARLALARERTRAARIYARSHARVRQFNPAATPNFAVHTA